MKKTFLKVFSFIFAFLFMFQLFGNVLYAEEMQTKLNVAKKASEKKYLNDDQGYITHEVIDFDADKGEVNLELKISNKNKSDEQKNVYDNTEVYLLIDENMVINSDTFTKKSANVITLAQKIINANKNAKVGIVGIKGTISDLDSNNRPGPEDEGDVRGTSDNAEIVIKPTNDINSIKNALNNMNPNKKKYHSNLQAAIRLANNSFSSNTNKLLISLYDRVPSIAIGVKSSYTYGGFNGEYRTAEEGARAKCNSIAVNTRSEILTLKDNAVSFILLRPEDTSFDVKYYSASTGKLVVDLDGSEYVRKLYGTIENPTYGKMYAYTSENLEKIITEDIYKEVEKSFPSTLTDIKITNYFTDEILNNFDFSYFDNTSVGKASQKINSKNGSIEWNIPSLDGNKTVSLKYKLTLKNNVDKNILEKLINVSDKVEVSYKINNQSYSSKLLDTPQLKISKIELKEDNEDDTKEEIKNEVKPSDWRNNPNTGMYV